MVPPLDNTHAPLSTTPHPPPLLLCHPSYRRTCKAGTARSVWSGKSGSVRSVWRRLSTSLYSALAFNGHHEVLYVPSTFCHKTSYVYALLCYLILHIRIFLAVFSPIDIIVLYKYLKGWLAWKKRISRARSICSSRRAFRSTNSLRTSCHPLIRDSESGNHRRPC